MYTKQNEDDDNADTNMRINKRNLREAATAVKDDAEGMAQEAGQHVRDFVDETEKTLKDATDKAKKTIRNKPIQSSVIALAVGVFLGMFFRR